MLGPAERKASGHVRQFAPARRLAHHLKATGPQNRPRRPRKRLREASKHSAEHHLGLPRHHREVPRSRKIVPRHHPRAPGDDFQLPEARLAMPRPHPLMTLDHLKARRHQRRKTIDRTTFLQFRLQTKPRHSNPTIAHFTPTTPRVNPKPRRFTQKPAQPQIIARDRESIPHRLQAIA
jgi:hypothetical protein